MISHGDYKFYHLSIYVYRIQFINTLILLHIDIVDLITNVYYHSQKSLFVFCN